MTPLSTPWITVASSVPVIVTVTVLATNAPSPSTMLYVTVTTSLPPSGRYANADGSTVNIDPEIKNPSGSVETPSTVSSTTA